MTYRLNGNFHVFSDDHFFICQLLKTFEGIGEGYSPVLFGLVAEVPYTLDPKYFRVFNLHSESERKRAKESQNINSPDINDPWAFP